MNDQDLLIWALELLIQQVKDSKSQPAPLILVLPGSNQAFFNLK